MSVKVSTETLENVAAGIAKVDIAMRSKAFGQALRAAVKPTEKAAKRYAPRLSGTLEESIGTKLKEYSGAFVAIVEPRRPPALHRHLVEFGHHLIMFGVDTGTRVEPHPYMAPAIVATRDQVQREFDDKVTKIAQKQWQT
jgi:hypothetical protein